MSDIIPRKEEPIDGKEIMTTMAKVKLQWIINKHKKDPSYDYTHEILFAKFKLEKASGKKVNLRI
jgi:hypothetical protein